VQSVLVTAGRDCLEERRAARGYEQGFGRWSLTAADRLPREYDLTFDSERMGTQECAVAVASSWNGHG
jgi:chloramphenicol 3-O-phosphotransferase